jgi:hypothetical protein
LKRVTPKRARKRVSPRGKSPGRRRRRRRKKGRARAKRRKEPHSGGISHMAALEATRFKAQRRGGR